MKAWCNHGKHCVQERERVQAEEVEAARHAAHDAGEAFALARQSRHDAFITAFEHVSGCIDGIFKDLTHRGANAGLTGARGSAYLMLQDRDNPFLGGITYSAMPPSKRFRDMDQLSGGEKVSTVPAFLSGPPCPEFQADIEGIACAASRFFCQVQAVLQSISASCHHQRAQSTNLQNPAWLELWMARLTSSCIASRHAADKS